MADDVDIKALGDEIKKALGGISDGPDARKQRKLALQKLAHDEKGVKLQTLENTNRSKIVKSLAKTKEGYKELDKDLKDIRDSFAELNDSVRSVRSSLRGFGHAAYTGTGSISEFTESLRGSSTVLNFIADLGKTFDVNAETFRGLAEVGGNFNQSIVEMRNAAASAALPLDDFAQLVKNNSTTLAALYGTTTKGAIAIAGLSEALRTEATPELASLGFTVDEINETLLTNMDRQRRQGIFDQLTAGQRVQSAKDFAMELDRLAKLTGQQRSELRAQLEQQATNARFAAFIRTQDEDTQRRLSGFAATVSSVAPQLGEGLQDIIANAGRPVTDAGITLVQNIPQLQGTIQNLIAGTITSEQALMQMRDMSTKSLDRFSKAAVTGTVPFLELTPGLVSLSTLTMDYGKVLDEQGNVIAGGTSTLMRFQENAKRLSAATQSLETGFYSMLGALGGDETNNVVGAIGKMSDNFIKGTSDFTKAVLYGTKTIAGMGLNLLKNTLPTYMAVYQGTLRGTTQANMFGSALGGKAGKGAGMLARGAGKALPWAGAIGTTGMSVAGLMDDDKTNDKSSAWGLAGGAIGAVIGGLIGGLTTGGMGAVPAGLWGATLGNMAGSALGGMVGGKAFGGPIAGGETSLVGERGPEIIRAGTASTVTANADLKNIFNTESLEKHLSSISSNIVAANKIHTQHLETLNTGTMIQNKIRIASETTARKRYEIGNV